MMVSEFVDVKIINKNINHYMSIGYKCSYGDIIRVNPSQLTNGSHVRVDVMCVCGKINNIKYQDYLRSIKHGYYSCQSCSSDKIKKTCISNYGVDNPSKSKVIKVRKASTTFKNYGVDNPFQSEEIKSAIRYDNVNKYGVHHYNMSNEYKDVVKNRWIVNNTSEMIIYRNEVNSLTRKNKSELISNWNGIDFYDGEYIKDNYRLPSNDPMYPTVDHKISIYNGFHDKISIHIISSLWNLCITKRTNNSQKSWMSDNEYKEKYNYENI